MAKLHAEIDDGLREWIARQHLFFVATAPSGDDGHVNLSPKGAMETFAVLGPHEVAYVDLFGSGIETAAHLQDNGRIVLMFCAFEGPPKIIRLHGDGEVIEPGDGHYPTLREHFRLPDKVAATVRAIIRVDVTRIADSCGFVVPLMTYEGERQQLYKTAEAWIRSRGPDAIRDYCDVNNGRSIDGLPGLRRRGAQVSPEQRATYRHEGRKL